MTWYITFDIQTEYMGGAGHSFFRIILPTYIMAELLGMEHVYTPFNISSRKATERYQSFIRKRKLTEDCGLGTLHTITDEKWSQFWDLRENEKDKDELECERAYKSFTGFSITIDSIINGFSSHDGTKDILFVVRGKWGINYDEVYRLFPDVYKKVRRELKRRCTYKANTIPKCITLHIRRSDLHKQHLNRLSTKKYYKLLLDTVLKYITPSKIRVVSCGSQKEMDSIKKCFKTYSFIEFYLNVDTFETFKRMMDTDIMLAGVTTFSLVAAYYSNAKIVIQCRSPNRHYPIAKRVDDLSDAFIVADHKTATFNEKLFKEAIDFYYPSKN